jgi:hypothetical protein
MTSTTTPKKFKDPERNAMIDRIKIAAEALDIPQDAVDHVIKNGSSRHLVKATGVLLEFCQEYGVSLDYMISDSLTGMIRHYSSYYYRKQRTDAA